VNRFSRILAGKSAEPDPPAAPVHPADPRPDLEGDHREWSAVLRAAWTTYGDNAVYGLLHGLRCGGARLETRQNGRLHLDYTPLLEDGWTKDEMLNEWLKPHTQAIKAIFSRAEAGLRGMPPGQTLPMWARQG